MNIYYDYVISLHQKNNKKMSNNNDEFVQYGQCPGFEIWTKNGNLISGHMVIKKSDSKEVISQKLTDLVIKICKEEKLSEEETLNCININLKNNGFE